MAKHTTPPIQFTKPELDLLLKFSSRIADGGEFYIQHTRGVITTAGDIRAKVRAALSFTNGTP